MPTISLIGVKACTPSPDGDQVHVTFATKYTGDYKLAFTRECREQLLAALGVPPATPSPAPATSPSAPPATATSPSAPASSPSLPPTAKAAEPPDRVPVHVPTKWHVGADLKLHDVVLLVLELKAEAQRVYALDGEAAKQMAGALARSVDAVLAHKQAKQAKS
jgi:hypothetical protein